MQGHVDSLKRQVPYAERDNVLAVSLASGRAAIKQGGELTYVISDTCRAV